MSRFRDNANRGDKARHLAAGIILAAGLFSSAPAQAGPSDSDSSNTAKNLARMNRGAEIESITAQGRRADTSARVNGESTVAALIMEDGTVSYPLAEGATTFIVTLPAASSLNRFTFINENAAACGELKISVSNYRLPAASPRWTQVEGGVSFTNKRMFNLSLVGVEARYVKLTFHAEKGGRIAALGLYGAESLEAFGARQENAARIAYTSPAIHAEEMFNFNFANRYAKGRVVFVSSGMVSTASRMIDDDSHTFFRFSPHDAHPTAIVELAQEQRLHRVSALYKMQAGRLDFYLMDQLGADMSDLRGLKPIASITDRDKAGKAAVDFDPRGARYVVLRWTPEGSEEGFEVAEVNAFGFVPLSLFQLNTAPDVFASNENAVHLAGEGSPDFSNTLGTLADPPAIAPVSP